MREFDFEGLFIFDMANNHQGDVEHGLNIIKAMGEVTKETGVRGALKFQFRYIDTFIHPDYKDRKDIPHIPRFVSTRLSDDDYKLLATEVKKQGLITISTPFDEKSVELILDLDIELVKVASCSADDHSLLETVAETNRPVIVSTAGLTLSQIDRLVSFLDYRNVHFALMHCVALYPTPGDKLLLNQIEQLRNRFPDVPVGFSTHENSDNYSAVQIAYAKGARLFERHVGLETDKYKLNAYSSSSVQIAKWIQSYHDVVEACGGEERAPAYPDEITSLNSLKRGIFVKRDIKKGEVIKREDVFFAMPLRNEQMNSGEWDNSLIADKVYFANEPINKNLVSKDISLSDVAYSVILQVKGMLNNARIFVGKDSSIEISHHYGLGRFREFGAVIIDCINREYCKKLIIQLPRQKHPYHYHKKKEETFQLLHGDLEVELEGHKTKLISGDIFLVKPNQWHKFHTLDGAIFEEVSTTHYDDDSIYEDEKIALLPREKRKTQIANWEAVVRDTRNHSQIQRLDF
jgi:N-acetylneuraminate synthase